MTKTEELKKEFLDLEIDVETWLAPQQMRLETLLELQVGSVIEMEHDPDGPVDLVVNGKTVATGELVVVDGRFGFRVGTTSDEDLAALEDQTKDEKEPVEKEES